MSLSKNPRVEDYLTKVCSQIKNKKVHEEIRTELLGHLEEAASEHIAAGVAENEAVEKALAQMGEAEVTGQQLNKIHKTKPEWSVLILTLILTNLGLVTMYFIESKGVLSGYHQPIFEKSSIFTVIGIAIILGLYFFDYRKLRRYSKYIYIGTLLMVAFISLRENAGPMLSIRINSVTNSVNLIGISPFLFIIAIAGLFDQWNWDQPRKGLLGFTLGIVPAIFMISEFTLLPTAIIYSLTLMTLMFISGAKQRYILLTIASVIGMFGVTVTRFMDTMRSYLAFLNPSQDPQGPGYIYLRVKEVLHSAGSLGQGFKMDSHLLPAAHTDLIFTYIVYTFGWITGIVLTGLMIAFLIRLVLVARIIRHSYGKLLVSGFVTAFAVQVLWNILMNLGLAPIAGVELPFISYGGLQFIINMLAIGLITNIYKWRNAPQRIN